VPPFGRLTAVRLLTLPDDPLPPVDAVVSIGHVLSYLPDEPALWRGVEATGQALKRGGVVAFDICDLEWGEARRGWPNQGRVSDDWALITRFSEPSPARFVRQLAVFTRNADGSWRRDDERHENVLIDTSAIPDVLRTSGVDAVVGRSFGGEELPQGLRTVIGERSGT
jgi:hypothetical protein